MPTRRDSRRATIAAAKSRARAAQRLARSIATARSAPHAAPPPCFYFRLCNRSAEIEMCGRSVCRACAATNLSGREYPLRAPTRTPLYATDREAIDALDVDADIAAAWPPRAYH